VKYVLYAVAAVFLYFIISDVYHQMTKKGPNSTRLDCQKECKVFEKVYDKAHFPQAKAALLSGKYELGSEILKAKYMKSRLFEYVHLEHVDQYVKEAIANRHDSEVHSDKKVQIDYYIYENDKDDPGKKTKKSKLYAGYLVFTFMLDGKKIYVIQIDFLDMQGSDINKRVDCAIESFLTL